MTSEHKALQLPFWPFLLVDLLLLGLAAGLFMLAHRPLLWWEAGGLFLCVGGAAWSVLFPFLRRAAVDQAHAQIQTLAGSVAQIKNLEQVAAHITSATAQWQSVHGCATQIALTSKELSETMAAEAKSFAAFMQKANDTEKAHFRLEVEKLRRAEVEWLQVLTRILDHVFALLAGAVQSGQRNVIEQIGQFQDVCHDTARRVGLVPMVPGEGEAFDPRLHQLVEGAKIAEDKAPIAGTLASGYSYQGQVIRRAVVALQENPLPPVAPVPTERPL